jgi:hypothetical protein
MNIQEINTLPEKYNNFLINNKDQLKNIYEEGFNHYQTDIGILLLISEDSKNKIDVQFKTEEILKEIISEDNIEQYMDQLYKVKKIIIIQDIDNNNIYII